jgi:hypothetical protein
LRKVATSGQTFENGIGDMNIKLGLRALLLLAFISISTAVIVKPELIGGAHASTLQTINSVVPIGHH